MRYEAKGIRWKGGDGKAKTFPSYHCDYISCCVRYAPTDGYFTVIDEPDVPYFVDEPGTNLVRCPRHGTWLYREADDNAHRFALKCGVEGCDYAQADVEGIWLRE